MNGCEISTKSGAVWNAFPMDTFKSGLTTLEAKLHGIPTVSWLKSAAPKKYFPGGSNFQQVSNTSKCSKIFEDTLQILSRFAEVHGLTGGARAVFRLSALQGTFGPSSHRTSEARHRRNGVEWAERGGTSGWSCLGVASADEETTRNKQIVLRLRCTSIILKLLRS